jgi:hypothetical protein
VDILHALEARYPTPALLPPSGSEERARTDGLMQRCADVVGAGVRLSYPNASATQTQLAQARDAFEEQLAALDEQVAAGGGPFLAGPSFTMADAMCATTRRPSCAHRRRAARSLARSVAHFARHPIGIRLSPDCHPIAIRLPSECHPQVHSDDGALGSAAAPHPGHPPPLGALPRAVQLARRGKLAQCDHVCARLY